MVWTAHYKNGAGNVVAIEPTLFSIVGSNFIVTHDPTDLGAIRAASSLMIGSSASVVYFFQGKFGDLS